MFYWHSALVKFYKLKFLKKFYEYTPSGKKFLNINKYALYIKIWIEFSNKIKFFF